MEMRNSLRDVRWSNGKKYNIALANYDYKRYLFLSILVSHWQQATKMLM